MVGNDIVDLSYFDAPSWQHVDYLKRVCAPEEMQDVRHSTGPCKHLAVLWAAKEAAYKLAAKQSVVNHFVPRQLVAYCDNDLLSPEAELVVSCAGLGLEVRVKTMLSEHWVHAVATSPKVKAVRWAVREIQKGILASSRVQIESEAVRSLAGDLLAKYRGQGLTLQFSGRIPALKQMGLQIGEMDVSLSHHGAFVSVAIACASRNGNALLCNSSSKGGTKDFLMEEMCYSSTA